MSPPQQPHSPRLPIRLALLAGALATGCGATPGAGATDAKTLDLPLDPVTRVVGELHLHQFPAGSHAWAAFVASPIELAAVHSDQLYQLDTDVTASEGPCRLWRRPSCPTGCPSGTYCAATDACRAVTPPTYVDGGAIHVTGSQLHDRIELAFADGGGYLSDPPPGAALLFAGGEVLRVSGGVGPRRLAGALPAPALLRLTRPAPEQPFHLPSTGALAVWWEPAHAAQIVIIISASTDGGDYGTIRCVGPDNGAALVPEALLAGLPGPPRANRIEVERDNEALLKTVTPAHGLLAHAAFSAWMNGSDP